MYKSQESPSHARPPQECIMQQQTPQECLIETASHNSPDLLQVKTVTHEA